MTEPIYETWILENSALVRDMFTDIRNILDYGGIEHSGQTPVERVQMLMDDRNDLRRRMIKMVARHKAEIAALESELQAWTEKGAMSTKR